MVRKHEQIKAIISDKISKEDRWKMPYAGEKSVVQNDWLIKEDRKKGIATSKTLRAGPE